MYATKDQQSIQGRDGSLVNEVNETQRDAKRLTESPPFSARSARENGRDGI